MLTLITALATTFTLHTARAESSVTTGNKLLPFTSDGCSRFPNGIPLINKNKWLHCCINHDVQYWKGGTAEQRKLADAHLGQCVAETGEGFVGEAMQAGVRVGGYVALPTSFRWGYGWVQNRGYKALNSEELQQVAALQALIPKNLLIIPLENPSLIKKQETMTSNICFDQAIFETEQMLGGRFHLIEKFESFTDSPEGQMRRISLVVAECKNPLTYEFLLLKPNACETAKDELTARGQIRLRPTKPHCEASPN